MEYTNAAFEAMTLKGYDIASPQSVLKAVQSDEVWQEAREVGLARGIPIAIIDGKKVRALSSNTADFQQVSTMLGWMGQKTDKFDVNAAINSSFKMLAPAYQLNKDDGTIRDDVRQNPNVDADVTQTYSTSFRCSI